MNKRKQMIVSVMAVLLLVLLTVGVTYAVFTYTKLGTTENTVTAGTLKFLYTENTGVGAGIALTDALPVSDTVGKSYSTEGKVFDFSIEATNSGNDAIPYEVTLRKKNTSTLGEEAVKVYLTDMTEDVDSELLEPTLYSDLAQTLIDVGEETEKTIHTDSVAGGELTYLKDFRLRMWVAEETDFSSGNYNGKTFIATVNVYSNVPLVSEEEINLRESTDIVSITSTISNATEVTGQNYQYEMKVPEGTTETTLNIVTESPNATVEVEKIDSLAYSTNVKRMATTKKVTLTDGDNYFKVKVISENKVKTKEYVLKIRAAKDDEARLDSLSLTNCTLSPSFNSDTTSYSCTVAHNVSSVEVTANPKSDVATTKVTGNTNLVTGENIVTVVVTAEDGTTTKTYTVKVTRKEYTEAILNGTDPVAKGDLVPVNISNTGVVTKASLSDEWYDYETKKWANAVILKSATNYSVGQTIPESNIESYFVWIPKFSYKIWDLGNYSSLTSISNKVQTINIKFGLTNTSDSVSGECTTPGTAGTSGSCGVGEYMTHPAFTSFNSNGFWVGKFETGYDGATSTTGAEQDVVNTNKIIIKPNVYSWRNIKIGNIFKNGYDYMRSLDSHAMKNTEWGAVAYLQHSAYGSATSVRINNNSNYITGYAATEEPTKGSNAGVSIEGNRNESTSLGVDGTYTVNYKNTKSQVASTTGNYTGVYDMSGGSNESVMGYAINATTDLSGITSLYPNFFTNSTYTKYWDKYTTNQDNYQIYNNGILGDATSEMGPFGMKEDPDGNEREKTSWYNDQARFIRVSYPWFQRSANFKTGNSAGIFFFAVSQGDIDINVSYRIVLTPAK